MLWCTWVMPWQSHMPIRVPRIFLVGVEVHSVYMHVFEKRWAIKVRVCMTVDRVLIAVTNVYNEYSAENLYAPYCMMNQSLFIAIPVLYNKQPKPIIFG